MGKKSRRNRFRFQLSPPYDDGNEVVIIDGREHPRIAHEEVLIKIAATETRRREARRWVAMYEAEHPEYKYKSIYTTEEERRRVVKETLKVIKKNALLEVKETVKEIKECQYDDAQEQTRQFTTPIEIVDNKWISRWESFTRRIVKINTHSDAKTLENQLENEKRRRVREAARLTPKKELPYTPKGVSHPGKAVLWHAGNLDDACEKAKQSTEIAISKEKELTHRKHLIAMEKSRILEIERRMHFLKIASDIQHGV